MLGFNGGLIGAARATTNASSVPGVWTCQEQSVAERQGAWPTMLLQRFPGAAGAYSLRQLSKTISTVVRVRRSSDNSESDFTALQVIDGTLVAWVGAGNAGFVRTLYDQSGNGINKEQTTAADQPLIVSSGALLTRNGRPVIRFGSKGLTSTGVTTGAAQSIFSVVYHPANVTTSTGPYYAFRDSGANTSFFGFGAVSVTINNERMGWLTNFSGITRIHGQVTSDITAGTYLYTVNWNGNNSVVIRQNGVSQSLSVGSGGAFTSTTDPQAVNAIGRTLDATAFELGDLIIYASDQSANHTAIEANINAYFSIY